MNSLEWVPMLRVHGTGSDGVDGLPLPRFAHAAAAMSDTRMAMVGGFSRTGVLGDVWILTLLEVGDDGALHVQVTSLTARFPCVTSTMDRDIA